MNSHIDYVAEVQMSYKVERQKPYSDWNICSSDDSELHIRTWFAQNNFGIEYREYFGVVYLNGRNNILGFNLISIGSVTGTVADPKLVLQGALLTNASAFVIFHNHPSGGLKPSFTDILLTKKIKEAAGNHGFKLHDHLIVTPMNGFFSFADENML